MNKLDAALEAVQGYNTAKRIHTNTRQALSGNLPKNTPKAKRKLKKYEEIIARAHVHVINATEKMQSAFKKLSSIEKAQFEEITSRR